MRSICNLLYYIYGPSHEPVPKFSIGAKKRELIMFFFVREKGILFQCNRVTIKRHKFSMQGPLWIHTAVVGSVLCTAVTSQPISNPILFPSKPMYNKLPDLHELFYFFSKMSIWVSIFPDKMDRDKYTHGHYCCDGSTIQSLNFGIRSIRSLNMTWRENTVIVACTRWVWPIVDHHIVRLDSANLALSFFL